MFFAPKVFVYQVKLILIKLNNNLKDTMKLQEWKGLKLMFLFESFREIPENPAAKSLQSAGSILTFCGKVAVANS